MPWIGWLIIASFVVLAGAIFALKRQRQLCMNQIDLHQRESGCVAGYDEPELAESPHGPDLKQQPVEEVTTPGLVGLMAHRYFMEAVEREWQRSARTGRHSSLILMRLDGLQRVIGGKLRWGCDKAQTAVAALVEAGSRPPNIAARYTEDELAILMPEADARQAATLAEALRASVAANRFLRSHKVTACFGIASFPDRGRSLEEILEAADSEMCLANYRNGNGEEVDSRSPKPGDPERIQGPPATHSEAAVTGSSSTSPGTPSCYSAQLEQKKPSLGMGPTFSFSVDANGPYPKGHSQAVSWVAIQIARQAGLSQEEVDEIHLGGLLHDIGKFDLPERVFTKPTLLTPEEYEIMKSHAAKGAKILEPLGVKAVERIVRHHHERYDGTGYPDGLAGDEIPLGARIVAVADSFEDMVSDLAYKKRRTFEDAVAEFRRCSGSQFDPDVVAVFLEWVNIHGDPRENESDESKVA
jgi:diguanylate cyclase (GGDEF)-like protein/putative nucleotidyltransferase with HDIG domain